MYFQSQHRIEVRKAKKPAKEVSYYTYFLRTLEILILAFKLGHVATFSIQDINFGRQPVLDLGDACLFHTKTVKPLNK